MYKLLIVDDEDVTVDVLVSSINWEQLDIGQVLTANNVQQARKILLKETVDIILCDIEMPGQDGLELLAWIKQENIPAVCIILSGHANFEYARKAMDLDSIAYVLKPIPFGQIEQIILQAEQKLLESRRMELFANYGEKWLSNSDKVHHAFWREVLLGDFPEDAEKLRELVENRDLSIDVGSRYCVLIFYCMQRNVSQENWYKTPNLPNILAEELADAVCLPLIVNTLVCCIIPNNVIEVLSAKCEAVLSRLKVESYTDVSVFAGKPAKINELNARYLEMLNIIRRHITYRGVYMQGITDITEAAYTCPDMTCWSLLLSSGKTDKLRSEIRTHLKELSEKDGLSGYVLECFYHDFMQMVYSVISEKGFPANTVFPAEDKSSARPDALEGILAVYRWTDYIVEQTILHVAAGEDCRSVEDQVKSYIRQNILKGVSRADIADYIHLSPEYLSRLFKHSSGISLSDYIQQERIITAKSLLSNTQLPVSEIAGMLGYSNFAYFSQMFKKMTGKQPMAYRNEEQNQE